MIKNFKNKIKTILSPFILYQKRDGNIYYGEYIGSFNFWRKFLWNIFHPLRLYNRFRHGQLFRFKKQRAIKFKKNLMTLSSSEDKEFDHTKLCNKFDEFLRYGGVVIQDYFSDHQIQQFLNKYSSEIENIQNTKILQHNVVKQEQLKISKELVEIWMDPKLMTFLSSFVGKEILARNYPYMQYHNVVDETSSKLRYEKKITKAEGSDVWHIDTPFLVNIHILLEDLSEEDSCMLYLPGSNKLANMGNLYSDESVKKSDIEPLKCIGKRGTVYFHEGNTLHKLRPKPGTSRFQLHFEFTFGGTILLDCYGISKCLSSESDLNTLSSYQRNIVRGIFPKKMNQGYEIKKEALSPTKIIGI